MTFVMKTAVFPQAFRRKWLIMRCGGGGGIRTHEGLRPAGFQDRSHKPLDHPSKVAIREKCAIASSLIKQRGGRPRRTRRRESIEAANKNLLNVDNDFERPSSFVQSGLV